MGAAGKSQAAHLPEVQVGVLGRFARREAGRRCRLAATERAGRRPRERTQATAAEFAAAARQRLRRVEQSGRGASRMAVRPTEPQRQSFERVLSGLHAVGFPHSLVRKGYTYEDWFEEGTPE